MKDNSNTVTAKISLEAWALLVIVSLIWGSSYILMKKGLTAFQPEELAIIRILLCMFCLLPFLPRSLKQVEKKDWKALAVVGIIGSGIPPFLFAFAQTQLDSAAAGVLNSLTPLFTFVLGILFFAVPLTKNRFLGVLLGLIGASYMVWSTAPMVGQENNYWYGLFVVLATICYAISANVLKESCQHIPATAINVLSTLIITFPALIYFGLNIDMGAILTEREGAWQALGYISILAILGTAFAKILFFRLTQMTDALFASMVTYLLPLIAVLWGVLDGEGIGFTYVIGMLLILSGVYLASKGKKVINKK